MVVIIKTGFTSYSDGNLSDKAQIIINSTGADLTDYPTPSPKLIDVQAAKDAFDAAKADRGSKAKTAFKNEKRKELIVLLNLLALYIQQNCLNDETIALKSGYDIRKQRTPVGVLPKPTNFKVGPGKNPGEIEASVNSFGKMANSYIFRFSQVDGSDPDTWQSLPNSSSKMFIGSLSSGKKVSVQAAGVGASKKLVWTDTITVYVL